MIKLRIVICFAVSCTVTAFGTSPSSNSLRYEQSANSFYETNKRSGSNLSMFRDGFASRTVNKMKTDKTKLGNLEVPSVGVGTISWSSKSLTTLHNLELQSLVTETVCSNGALFDTAERYGNHLKTALGLGWGETETLLSKLIKQAAPPTTATSNVKYSELSSSPIIATKFTPSPWRTTVESVVEACEQSRKRLNVEQIDLYQLHMPDIVKPFRFLGFSKSLDEVYWEGLAECYKRGLVKNVGVSNYGPTLVSKCHSYLAERDVPLASNQIAYSLIGRKNGAQETVDKCTELGVQVLAYYPFAMGLLTGKYTSDSLSSDAELLTSSSKTALEIKDLSMYATPIQPLLQTMEQIAKRRKKTVSQVALNYIMCKGVIPIPGARTVAQVKDNIGAMGWRLTKAEVNRLEVEADKLDFNFEGAGFKKTSEKFVGYGVEKWSLD